MLYLCLDLGSLGRWTLGPTTWGEFIHSSSSSSFFFSSWNPPFGRLPGKLDWEEAIWSLWERVWGERQIVNYEKFHQTNILQIDYLADEIIPQRSSRKPVSQPHVQPGPYMTVTYVSLVTNRWRTSLHWIPLVSTSLHASEVAQTRKNGLGTRLDNLWSLESIFHRCNHNCDNKHAVIIAR